MPCPAGCCNWCSGDFELAVAKSVAALGYVVSCTHASFPTDDQAHWQQDGQRQQRRRQCWLRGYRRRASRPCRHSARPALDHAQPRARPGAGPEVAPVAARGPGRVDLGGRGVCEGERWQRKKVVKGWVDDAQAATQAAALPSVSQCQHAVPPLRFLLACPRGWSAPPRRLRRCRLAPPSRPAPCRRRGRLGSRGSAPCCRLSGATRRMEGDSGAACMVPGVKVQGAVRSGIQPRHEGRHAACVELAGWRGRG